MSENEMSSAERKLRFLLAVHKSNPGMYVDDGELQDNTETPNIDFLRDDPNVIEAKLIVRAQNRLQKQYDGEEIVIDYTNWEGKRDIRHVKPLRVVWGSTSWHPDPQWLLVAIDVRKNAERKLAMKDIHLMTGKIDWILPFLSFMTEV